MDWNRGTTGRARKKAVDAAKKRSASTRNFGEPATSMEKDKAVHGDVEVIDGLLDKVGMICGICV